MASADTPRILAVMGSGETAPTMVTVHKELVARLGRPRPSAVLIETPYGFQENADDISARAQRYFADSVQLDVGVAALRSPASADAAMPSQRAEPQNDDRDLARISNADWLFAGPGSPSYALAQWRGSAVADALRARVGAHGVTIFSSAAACTVGMVALPVYEVYKVGMPPVWLEGLDLLAGIELPVAVVPHYDNSEGGNHDTRYCYMGERRLAVLERELPEHGAILGVDEHTAALFDLGEGVLSVRGRGVVTVRRGRRSDTIPAGSDLDLTELRALVAGTGRGSRGHLTLVREPEHRDDTAPEPERLKASATLWEEAARCESAFAAAEKAQDIHGMVEAVVALDNAIVSWSSDTLQSDDADRAHALLRSLVVRLGDVASSRLRDPRSLLAPIVGPLLRLREERRSAGAYDTADALRNALAAGGVQLRDTPDGTDWSLADN